MTRLAVIDDEKTILEDVEEIIKGLTNITLVLKTSDVNELFKFLDTETPIDVVLLDINMPLSNGFDIAAYLKSSYPEVKIIFMSAHQDFALQGYKFYPEDFLTKPINIIRLKQTLDRIGKSQKRKRKIGVKTSGRISLIDTSTILYAEKKGRKTLIHIKDSEPVECSEGLNRIEEILQKEKFFRTHQSFLVSLDYIESIESDHYMKSYNITLQHCKTKISLSRHKFTTLKSLIDQQI
jgi:two-component system, LytTR family, response regulator